MTPSQIGQSLQRLADDRRIEAYALDYVTKPRRWAIQLDGQLHWWSTGEIHAFIRGANLERY